LNEHHTTTQIQTPQHITLANTWLLLESIQTQTNAVCTVMYELNAKE